MEERIPYEEFSTNIKKCIDEQRLIIDDIIHKKHKYPLKPLHIFLIEVVGIGKTSTLMCIIQNMFRYYKKKNSKY
jgi:hypothetical protein